MKSITCITLEGDETVVIRRTPNESADGGRVKLPLQEVPKLQRALRLFLKTVKKYRGTGVTINMDELERQAQKKARRPKP